MYLVISFNDASFGLKVLKWFCEIFWELWRKNRCALRRCGFNMPLIFARSINLNLAKWFCYLSSLSSLSLPFTLCLSANASLTNIINKLLWRNFISTIFSILYWFIYAIYHSFIYICTYWPYLPYLLGIILRIILQHFYTYQNISIYIQCTKNSRILCGQEDAKQTESVLDCKVPCNLNQRGAFEIKCL